MLLVLGLPLAWALLVLASPTAIDLLTGTHRVDAIMLGKETGNELPPGSSLPTVKKFLDKRFLEFSYEPSSKTLYAVVREAKGSSFLVRKSVTFCFRFGKCHKLESTDTRILFTGP